MKLRAIIAEIARQSSIMNFDRGFRSREVDHPILPAQSLSGRVPRSWIAGFVLEQCTAHIARIQK